MFSANVLYLLRNFRSKKLFAALENHAKGKILDVGGGSFFSFIKDRPIKFDTWTTLERNSENIPAFADPRFNLVIGNGCHTEFPSNNFDLVLNIQVLEHEYEPLRMIQEIFRVLKPGGTGIFLIPQTANIHLVPFHFYNFTIFFIKRAFAEAGFQFEEITPLGGGWSTIASRLFYMVLQGFSTKGFVYTGTRKNLFYLLLPFMVIYSIVNIPICLFFSLADINEEPNNHLVVVKKPLLP